MKKRQNKALAGLLSLSLLASLSACSSDTGTSNTNSSSSENSASSSTNSEQTKLTLWHYYNANTKDVLDEIIAEFNDTKGAELNVVVEALSYSSVNDLAEALVSSAREEVGAAPLPDIFSAYTDTALLLAEMDAVATLDPYFSDSELALFQQDFLNEGRFYQDEALRIVPVAKSTELLFLNETDFQVFSDATGVSMSQMATWEGMAEVAEVYYNWTDEQTPEIQDDGSALFGLDSQANFLMVATEQLGEAFYIFEEDSVRLGLSEDAARQIWNAMFVPYIKGHYAEYGGYRSDDVKSGDLLAYSGSTSSVYYFPTTVEIGRAEAYDIEGTAMAYPYFASGDKVVVQQGAGMMVSKSNEAQESVAVEFLKWFTAAEYNMEFAVSTGYMPVQNAALTLDGIMTEMGDDISNIVRDNTETIYGEAIENYRFFATKPFDGSYDARSVLTVSIKTVVEGAQEVLGDATGEERASLLAELTGEEAFQAWYADLHETIGAILD